MKVLLFLVTTVVTLAIFLVGCSPGESPAPPTTVSVTYTTTSSELTFPTETTIPTASPVPPADSATPIPIIASNGLGAHKDVWEQIHGAPTVINSVQATYNGGLQVTFDERGVIKAIAGDFENTGMVSLDQAKSKCLNLIPGDAVHTYHFDHPTINPEGGMGIEPLVLVDIYKSSALSTLFSPEVWFQQEPGTFYVEYHQYKSKGDRIGAFFMELSLPP